MQHCIILFLPKDIVFVQIPVWSALRVWYLLWDICYFRKIFIFVTVMSIFFAMRYLFLPRGFCLCLHIFVIALKYSSTSIKRLTSGCTSKLPLHGGWSLNRGLSWISIILSSKTTLFWNMRARGEALLIHNRSQLPSQTVFNFLSMKMMWTSEIHI